MVNGETHAIGGGDGSSDSTHVITGGSTADEGSVCTTPGQQQQIPAATNLNTLRTTCNTFSTTMPSTFTELCVVILDKRLLAFSKSDITNLGKTTPRRAIDKMKYMFNIIEQEAGGTEDKQRLLRVAAQMDGMFNLPKKRRNLSALYDHAKFFDTKADRRATERTITTKGISAKMKKRNCPLGDIGTCLLCHTFCTGCDCNGCTWVPPS